MTSYDPKVIYLEPRCGDCAHLDDYPSEGRLWCEDDVWEGGCHFCGKPAAKYTLVRSKRRREQ